MRIKKRILILISLTFIVGYSAIGQAEEISSSQNLVVDIEETIITELALAFCEPYNEVVTEDKNKYPDHFTAIVNNPPIANCKDYTAVLDAINGVVSISPSNIDNGSFDNDGDILSLSVDLVDFNCGDIGQNEVTLEVSDGITSTFCIAQIFIVDINPPVAQCQQDITVQLDSTGHITIDASQVDNGSNDLCTDVNNLSMSLSQYEFTCSDAPVKRTILTVTDTFNNSSSCFTNVHIQNVTAPSFDMVNPLSVSADENCEVLQIPTPITLPDVCNYDISFTTNPVSLQGVGNHDVDYTVLSSVRSTEATPATTLNAVTSPFQHAVNAHAGQITIGSLSNIYGTPELGSNIINVNSTSLCENQTCLSSLNVPPLNLSINIPPYAISQTFSNDNVITTNKAYGSLNIANSTTTTIQGDVTIEVTDQLRLKNSAKLIIDGNVRIKAGSLYLQNFSKIEIISGSLIIELSEYLLVRPQAKIINNAFPLLAIAMDYIQLMTQSEVDGLYYAGGLFEVENMGVINGSICGEYVVMADQILFNYDTTGESLLSYFVSSQETPIIHGYNNDSRDVIFYKENSLSAVIDYLGTDNIDSEGNGLSWSIVNSSADASHFYIDSDGKLYFSNPPDFESPIDQYADNYYDVAIELRDSDNNIVIRNLFVVVTDRPEFTSNLSISIEVVDDTPPNAICKDISITLDNSGNGFIQPNDVDNGSTDNCSFSISKAIDQANFTSANIGNNTVVLTVTDDAGNSNTCNARVVILPGLDSDGDGISDDKDLDDDNDGIPDEIECPSLGQKLVNGSFEEPIIMGMPYFRKLDATLVPGWETDQSANEIELWRSSNYQAAQEGNNLCEVQNDDFNSIYQELALTEGSVITWEGYHSGRFGEDEAEIFIGSDLGNLVYQATMIDDENSWGYHQGYYTVPMGQTNTVFLIKAVNSINLGVGPLLPEETGNLVDNWKVHVISVPTDVCDFDLDGIPNYLDLDSDNDGIYDGVEAGHLVSLNQGRINGSQTDFGNNGIYNNLETSPNSGVLNYTIADSDTDGSYNFLDADSDADGCYDVTEAGFIDGDNNGYLAMGIIGMGLTVDDAGRVTSATDGYTMAQDNNLNGIADYVEASSFQLTCSGDMIQSVQPAICSAYVVVTAPTVSFCSSDYSLTNSQTNNASNADDFYPIGTTTVEWTATYGLDTATCTQTITIQDDPPGIECQDINLSLDITGNVEIEAADVVSAVISTCSPPTLSINFSSFNCNDIGTVEVTATADYNNGLSASCLSIVTIADGGTPTINCNDTFVIVDNSGSGNIQFSDVANVSGSNCTAYEYILNVSSFDCSNIGLVEVTASIIDGNNIIDNCISNVTVVNGDTPTVQCNDLSVTLNTEGNTDIVFSEAATVIGNNCTNYQYTLNNYNFTCADIGTVEVTATISDNGTLIDNCISIVTVTDSSMLSLVCRDTTVVLDAFGNANIVLEDIASTNATNCNQYTPELSQSIFDCSDIGSVNVNVSIMDGMNIVAECNSQMTVEDNIPELVCNPITISLDDSGVSNIQFTEVAIVNGGNCTSWEAALSQDTFTCTEVGIVDVVVSILQEGQIIQACIASVTVTSTLPSIQCNDFEITLDPEGNGTILFDQVATITNGSCSIYTQTLDVSNLTCDNLGIVDIQASIIIEEGDNIFPKNCNAQVTVIDNTAPSVICPSTQDIILDENCQFELLDYATLTSVADNCNGNITYDQYFNNNNETAMPGLIGWNWEEDTVGITIAATDISGNIGYCSLDLQLTGITNTLTVTCPDTLQIAAGDCGTYVQFTEVELPEVIEGCNYSITNDLFADSDSIFFNIGESVLTWNISTVDNQHEQCIQTIAIQDLQPPLITCPNDTIQCQTPTLDVLTQPTIEVTCDEDMDWSYSMTSNGNIYTVLWTVTDASGNITTCQQVIEDAVYVSTPDAGADRDIGIGNTVTLEGNDPELGQVMWTGPVDVTILNPMDISTPARNLTEGDNTFIYEIYEEGCISLTDTVTYFVTSFFMPTGFSPNNDGVNDWLVIQGITSYPESTLHIFDRSGKKVFSQKGYENDWGGTGKNGSLLPRDTYFYILELPKSNSLKGTIEIKY